MRTVPRLSRFAAEYLLLLPFGTAIRPVSELLDYLLTGKRPALV